MIVDASALLLLPLPHGDVSAARRFRRLFERILGAVEVQAPGHLPAELGHVVHRRRRSDVPGWTAQRAELVRRLVHGVTLRPFSPLTAEIAGAICERQGASYYDSLYVVEARITGSALLTADAGLHAHAKAAGVRAFLLPENLVELETLFPDAPES